MSDAPQTTDPRLAKLLAGEPLKFPPAPTDRKETEAEEAARTIPAAWLEELAPRPGRVVAVSITISNAIIEGPLDLRYATFEYELSVRRSQFKGAIVFSFAHFKRSVDLSNSHFQQPAYFRGARAENDFHITGATFPNETSFQDLHVGEVLGAQGATFGKVNFERIDVGKSAFFCTDGQGKRVEFGGQTRFHGAHLHGNAEFGGAQFKAGAAFDRLQVDGNAFFRTDSQGNRVEFGGEARFLGAHVHGDAAFSGAQFKAPAAFDGAQVDGDAFFVTDNQGNRLEFGGEARFLGAHVHGDAAFSGAQFKARAAFDGFEVDGAAFFRTDDQGNRVEFGGEARFHGAHIHKPASFLGAQFKARAAFDGFQVDGNAFFRPDSQGNRVEFDAGAVFPSALFGSGTQFTRAQFRATADFDNARFQGPADFTAARFAEQENANTTFVGARFERGVSFASASFMGATDFTAAIADRDAYFHAATFSKDASFREARFAVVHFEAPDKKASDPQLPTTFVGGVDLRGFRYDRISLDWRSLLNKLTPYDRQPYAQLETAIRATGDDRTANDVYYARRVREMGLRWQGVQNDLRVRPFIPRELPRAAFDSLQWALFRFGVRPYRLLWLTLLVLALGVSVFGSAGAVQSRNPNERKNDLPPLTTMQAIGVSLHEFLPVDIPSGSRWIPSENDVPIIRGWKVPCSAYATFHHLVGWALVPLGLAALTGLLRRPAKT